ncbi:MAG: hypothetical protein L0G07_10460, partial [Chryseobacterium sp.]|nr:hypothetical protein [Chryseobacterium sp.]
LEEIFNKTISEYNENTSDINKFKFSQREKDIFKGMIRRYATEVAQASLEKASERACIEPKGMMTRVYKESITQESNIVIL